MATIKQIFLNLPVKDLNRSVEFFTKAGFTFDKNFTNESGTCMIIGENIYAMLLEEKYFESFIAKPIARNSAEAIMALEVGSRQEVDDFINSAIAAGGKAYKEPEDHGWMYGRNFEDPDGHLWEAFYMDMAAMPKE